MLRSNFRITSFCLPNFHKNLTHWGWVTHICVSNLTIIGSDNGLSPDRHQTNAENFVDWTLVNKFQRNLNWNPYISLKKMHLKMSSGQWRRFCLGLNVLIIIDEGELWSVLCEFTVWSISCTGCHIVCDIVETPYNTISRVHDTCIGLCHRRIVIK